MLYIEIAEANCKDCCVISGVGLVQWYPSPPSLLAWGAFKQLISMRGGLIAETLTGAISCGSILRWLVFHLGGGFRATVLHHTSLLAWQTFKQLVALWLSQGGVLFLIREVLL